MPRTFCLLFGAVYCSSVFAYLVTKATHCRSFGSLAEAQNFRKCYRTKYPLSAKIHSVSRIGSDCRTRSFYHIVVDHGKMFQYTAGQYCGIIPPGTRNDINRPHNCRSYTMTTLRDQDRISPENAFAICVRTPYMEEYDEFVGDNSNRYICSRFLASAKPGDEVKVLGPFTGHMLLTDTELAGASNIIMIATGAGIAPFREHLKLLFRPAVKRNTELLGKIFLIFGVQANYTFIYREELEAYQELCSNRFRLVMAYSQEDPRAYVQDKILEHGDYIKNLCDDDKGHPCGIYVCGRTGMETAVRDALAKVLHGMPERQRLLDGVKVEAFT